MKQLLYYADLRGREPFKEWLADLPKDQREKVDIFVVRVALGGSKKNVKPVGNGVYEIIIDYGPGIRVYFADVGIHHMVMLTGGDKSTQNKDIQRAIEYWSEYEKTKKL